MHLYSNGIKKNFITLLLFSYSFRTKKDLIDDGIQKSKKFLIAMFKQVQNALDMRQVISAGPFFYVVIQEVSHCSVQ